MNFMIFNIDIYDDLLGLDFFTKIGDNGHWKGYNSNETRLLVTMSKCYL
jgi:hypothetical protein